MTKDELLARVRERFQERAPGARCPLCGSVHWTWNPELTAIAMSGTPNVYTAAPSQVMPVAALICDRCGNIHFVNLIPLGLLEEVTAFGQERANKLAELLPKKQGGLLG